MTPEMSEFSFGYALTSELIHHYEMALVGAPRFPTQNEEGKIGGYDVSIPRYGVPLFLQFKRSECLVRTNAAEAARLGVPYYRMHLMAKRFSAQHDLLLDLENGGNEVYYAAPRFHTLKELNKVYLSSCVATQTSFIRPSWISSLPDDKDHYVAIRSDDHVWLMCSKEPREIPSRSSNKVLRSDIKDAAVSRRQKMDNNFFRDLGDRLISSYEESVRARREAYKMTEEDFEPTRKRARAIRADRRPTEYAQEVSQMLFGCEMLIALAD